MIVTLDPQDVLKDWAEHHFDKAYGSLPPETIALGVIDEHGEIHAVACLNAFYSGAAAIHIASDRKATWATRTVGRAIFGYAFNFLGLRRISATTSVNNIDAQVLALRLGFQFDGRTRCGADDGSDGIILGMLASECRWINDMGVENGKDASA